MDAWGLFRNASNITSGGITSSIQESTDLPNDHNILEAFPVITDPLDGGWFGKIGTSAVLVFGTFGNLMTIAILRLYHSSWSAMNLYLTALAISDTAMLYSTALPMCVRKVTDFDMYITHTAVCKALIWMTNASAMASAYILVALTIQRALSVVWPHRVNVLCTQEKSVTVIAVVTMVCGLTWSHVLYGYNIVHITSNGTSARCTFGSQSYQHFWINYWVKADLFITTVIPLILLLISNGTLGWKLALSVKEAQQRFSSSAQEGQERDRKKKASSLTLTIIVVSTAFIITTLPFMIYNTLYQHFASQDDSSRRLHYFIYDLFVVFGLANFGWNFYLYCMTGTKFRRDFVNILSKCCGCVTSASGANQVREVPITAAGSGHMKIHNEVENNDEF